MSKITIAAKKIKSATVAPASPPEEYNLMTNAMRLTGDYLPAAWLLLRAKHWTKYVKVQAKGEKWIVKTRVEWVRDTRLTLKQVRNALDVLKSRELIELRQLPYSNKNQTHMRLTSKAILQLDSRAAAIAHPTPGNVIPFQAPTQPGPAEAKKLSKAELMAVLNDETSDDDEQV